MRALRSVAAATALLTIAPSTLGGCGGSHSPANVDPATLTPSSAPVYVSVAIRPAGGGKGDAVIAARKLTHLSDPYGSLAQSLVSTATSHPSWQRQLRPWMGQRAGIFLTSIDAARLPGEALSGQSPIGAALTIASARSFGSGAAQGAVVIDTQDLSRAHSFLQAQAHAQGGHAVSYRGVSFDVSSSGIAEGIVKRLVVIGSESGMKAAIDTSLTGQSLALASGYFKPSERTVATARLALQRLAGLVSGSSSGATANGLNLLGGLFAGAQTASLSVVPSSTALSLEGEVRYRAGSNALFGAGGAQALAALPGSAWLALGIERLDSNLPQALGFLRAAATLGASTVFGSLGGIGLQTLAARLDSDARTLARDFARWAGPAGVFVSGTGLFNLEAALVIASRDPAASRAEVGHLATLLAGGGGQVGSAAVAGTDAAATVKLNGFPAVIYVADGRSATGQSELIVGLGQASILGALNSASPLSISPAYSAALQALGNTAKPSLILEFPTLLGFLEGIGLAQNPPLAELVPYLKSLGTLSAGASMQGHTLRLRAVLGLSGTG